MCGYVEMLSRINRLFINKNNITHGKYEKSSTSPIIDTRCQIAIAAAYVDFFQYHWEKKILEAGIEPTTEAV